MNKKVIVAIDSNNIAQSKKLVKLLKKEVYAFKIGYEFFYNFGIEGYKEIKKICPKIFLDLKLHDIPNTVSKAIKAVEKLGPIFTTIHISGGDKMQNLSIKNRKKKLKILGVSILTSLDKKEINKYYNEKSLNKLVGKYVEYAKKNKLDGIVCSPHEIKLVRKKVGKKLIIVTPGIRLESEKIISDDQKRVYSPKKAIQLGADFLVIGRPIMNSKDPLKTIRQINKSI
tara:strand:- start:192 stop:875 length:684 start_codon:yes stop_codon:yes gene_type:complete